ncbi:MAG: ABC transporter substrate-binding protein [Candidatus Altiarchaeota archaeon]
MKTKIALLAVIMLLAIGGLLSVNLRENTIYDPNIGTITGKAVAPLTVVRIGYLPIASDLSFFVAKENGQFQKHGLIVEPIKLQSSNQAIDALIAGRVDGTSIVALEALLALEEKYPGEYVIYEVTAAEKDTEVHKIIVKKDSDIKTLKDLKGKTIGTFPGSQMKVFTKLVLGNYIDTSTITIFQMAPALQTQALASGQVNALFTLEPVGTIAEKKGIARVIAVNPLYNELLKPFPTAASVFSKEYANENPGAVASYVKAIEEAHDIIEKDKVQAKKEMEKYTSVGPEISSEIGTYKYWGVEEIDVDAIEKLIQLYVDNGLMKGPLDVESLIYRG